MEALTTNMGTLITNLSAVGEHVFETATVVVNFVVSNPICLIGTGLMLAGAAVGFVKRLITVA